MDPSNILISYSQALYSQWFLHKPTHCLFDAGEGVATTLGKKVFGIQNIFLTHGHEDHIAGISNLVNIRNIISGEVEKGFTIYYPRNDCWINELFAYIEKKQSGLIRYPLYVQPLEPGDIVEIETTKRPTRVMAVEVQHSRGQLCLGYEIQEERKVLDEYTGQSMHKYHPIFFYTGDTYKVDHLPDGRTDIAIYESTFLAHDSDKALAIESSRHSTVEQAVDWAASADVKNLILCHISDRYLVEEVKQAAIVAKAKSRFRGRIFIAHKDLIIPVDSNQVQQNE